MERHRALDSSMSSLYSGSGISNAPSHRQHEFGQQTLTNNSNTYNNNTSMPSSISPTPSSGLIGVGGSTTNVANNPAAGASAASTSAPGAGLSRTNNSNNNNSRSISADGFAGQGLRATTIGTVVLRCGPIQLVIALLQSPDKLHIKVVELEPKITTLAESFDGALFMQKQHDETLRNIQDLPGPMDEFVQKADKLLASKRISSELVNAMAETLNVIWQDILHLLHDRQQILHLCTQFHDRMTHCNHRMNALEVACLETMRPSEVSGVQEFLTRFKQLRIDMLTAVMAALKDGNELLAQLQELAKLETLDTRPDHIKRDATRAVHQVQQWLEALHDHRNALEIAWQTRKTQLEQCLALALLGRELDELVAALKSQRLEVSSMFSLGECEHSANSALHNYREWKQQALLLRDRALKITRAKEKLQSTGSFSADEACARAYNVLSSCTEHLDLVDQREHWLHQSRDFFGKAAKTLTVLEKLEVELSNVKLPPNSPQSFAMYAKVLRDMRGFTDEPLRLGYSILDEVGRTQSETQGVKRVLDEIENRKIYVESICAASNEERARVEQALSEFLEQYNDLLTWLMSSGQQYLQQHVDMGRSLQQSKQFLLQHHELMQDLEIKGELINLLLESIKVHLESLSPQQRYDVDTKAEALHKHWIELKDLVLKRVDCVSLLIDFFEKADQLASQLDNLDRQLLQTPDQQKLQFLQENWQSIRGDFGDLKSCGMRFTNIKIVDPYLETKSSTATVEEILDEFSKRQIDVTSSLENWTTHIEEKREVEIILERIMNENEETTVKTSKVDTQLYPVFSTASLDTQQLRGETRDKLSYVLQDIAKAQDEIQQRIQTTIAIQTKDHESLQKIEQVIGNLRTLKTKLDGIKYDYESLLQHVLSFLEGIAQLRQHIDAHFSSQQQQFESIDRIIVDHERFRDSCMDKFRSLIAQSELLIDRVRALEPPGVREIDTDRILKLLENLRIHFEAGNSERMSQLERLEKLEQFKCDLSDINRSLDSVGQQLNDINGQNIDSLAAAKTTSLAFEYFERTVENSMPKVLKPTHQQIQQRPGDARFRLELLEKRIERFTENTTQQLYSTNPESEAFVRDELRKLNEKWQNFKEQVKNKRNSLNQATNFFEDVEKIEAEYREISYFYTSISNKISYLRDPVEAANLVNDIEKYVGSREGHLRDKLDHAAHSAYDMQKVSTLYNDVMAIFQSFVKLKADISVVSERLKNEERLREQREREAREQAQREQAARESEARQKAAREEAARLQSLREQAAREQAQREQVARELAAREQAVREEEARLQAAREFAAREHAEREKMARDEAARLQALREQAQRNEEAHLQALRDQARREEDARQKAAREQAARDQAAREQAMREEAARLQMLRDEELRLQALREQSQRELEEARLRARREEESRLQMLRDEELRLQALRDRAKRDEESRLKVVRDQIDHQRIVTENIRKDVQINEIFTEIKYMSPRFTAPLKDAITREGEKVALECEVTGNPEPTVEWFKDGISIQSNSDYKTSYDKRRCRLVIEETFAADSARYTCRASNLVGVTETTASLSVRENAAEVQMLPPRIVRFLESGKAMEGNSFQFACVVTGNPLPTVQWYKNDKCIDDSPDYIINYNNGEATLRFEEVFLEDDAVYTCSASNPAGIEHCSASLIVEPLEPTEIPYFKIPLSNAMGRVGQKIKLEALIGGIPRPEIQWTHNGKPFQARDLKYDFGRITLLIPQAYPNDAGVYVLTAKNLAGEAYSSCNVIVKGRLPNETSDSEMASDMEPIKPSVQLPLKDISIFEGKPVRLDCVIVGQPEPEVIWYHNERPVKESADVQLLFQGDRCSLIIQEVYQEDGGQYKVVAINSAGEASSGCELKVTPLNIAEPATRTTAERQSVPKETQPKFERFLSDVLVDEGETVQLEVVATGDQPLSAKWFLSNKELAPDERISMVSTPESGVFRLVFKQVTADDKGVYTVKVSNPAGDAKCFSHLIVKSVNTPENQRTQQVEIVDKHECPEFKEVFSDRQAHAEEVVKFECIVKGKPTPKVHWYFNDQPVQGHNFLVSTSGERQVLTVQSVGPETVGKISCIAENEVGKATCVAFLKIIDEKDLAPPSGASSDVQTTTQEHHTDSSLVTIKKQTFTTTSTSQVNSYEGNIPQTEIHHSSAHIDQSVKQVGQQNPEIVESHHYQEMHKEKEMSSPDVQQKSLTLVQSAIAGTSSVSSGVPEISGVPESPTRLRKQIAPRFTTPLTGKIVDQGGDICMEAIYDGFPSPEIKVEKNGDALLSNERLKISNECNRVRVELKQVGVADAGRYSVTACNTMGQSTSTADLVVKKTIFPPVFGRRLQAQVVKRGEKVTMEVEVTGLPEPTVTWLKDEKPLNEAGLSAHRLISLGNSHKLIIEKGQASDSGKYMVRATNAGGEAKSIADCAILEPSPERMQEVVKTIVYETPSSTLKTENYTKEPPSFQTSQSETCTASDLHGLSESKIITEHRCTTEATMRLEHKSANLNLPELSQHPKTLTPQKVVEIEQQSTPHQLKTAATNTDTAKSQTDSTQTPPQVPPKPSTPVTANIVPTLTNPTENTTTETLTKSSSVYEKHTSEKNSSTVEYYKKIDIDNKSAPTSGVLYPKFEMPTQRRYSATSSTQPSVAQQENLQHLNLVPGSPPEMCYVTKLEQPRPKPTFITDKIKKLEDARQCFREPPVGGVALLPPLQATQTFKHESTVSNEVKLDYGQPVVRDADSLPTPAQSFQRSSSPKPSAEGLAMEKLWTPTHFSGYESCTNDSEHKQNKRESSCEPPKSLRSAKEHFEEKIREQENQLNRLPTPTTELSAPYLVKQVSQAIPINIPPIKEHTPLTDIHLVPGSPPEICFAPKQEERRQSLVETMEKTLEQNLKHGPSKVLPHSVPTITPQEYKPFKPPPPVLPAKFGRVSGEPYESDYESDRWKYSGSDSEETAFRGMRAPTATQATQRPKSMDVGASAPINAPNLKVSGYAADTEDISSYRKMDSMHESRYYESNKAQSQPQLVQQPPAQLFYPTQNGHESQEYEEFRREQKDFMKTSTMFSSTSYNTKSTGPMFQSTPIKPSNAIPTINRAPNKTPADYSDYSSEIDERFRSVSRTYESDPDIKGYRVVYPPTPTPTPRTNIVNGHKSPIVVVTPSPMEFEPTPAAMSSFSRPKFEPIKKEMRHEIKTEEKQYYQKQQQKQPTVFKPKPVAAKFLAAAQREPHQQQQPKTMYYNAIAGTPLHTAKMATETKNIMQMKESSETCQRVVNMQQTKRIIHFDNQKEESTIRSSASGQPTSPFLYSPSPSHMAGGRPAHMQPTPTPTRFVPGEFRDSDYDSEIDQAKIRPLWTPRGEYGDLRFRHVEPPHPGRSCSLPRTYERVLSPMEFDRGPEMPSKINIDVNTVRHDRGKGFSNAHQNKTHSLNRHSSMRNTNSNSYNQRYQTMEQQEMHTTNFPRDDMNLKVGSPPKYGYIQPYADTHGKQMGSTFLQKSHQFIDDLSNDVRRTTTASSGPTLVNGVGPGEPKVITHGFRPGFKRAPSEGDRPQAYRDESRVSQYGTKCVDPNTGLIYFKYDFGYEFGILFPGEGKKFISSQWNSAAPTLPQSSSGAATPSASGMDRKSPYPLNISGGAAEVVIPVQHERSSAATPSGRSYGVGIGLGPNSNLSASSRNGFLSDSETSSKCSPAGLNVINRDKKRYSLPNTQNIDINIDHLHTNDRFTRSPMLGTASELGTDVPVNAHLHRDDHPKKAPIFITPLKDIAVMNAQPARFECIVQCHPQPNVIWSKNGFELQNGNQHVVEYRNGVCRLTLPQAYLDDAGVYSCTATNPLGTATTSAQLLVTGGNRGGGLRF